MPKRIETGTDIAAIGVWDPGRHYPEKPKDYSDFVEAEADAGRLFFINTTADGGYPADIYVEEQPDPDLLRSYRSPERAFLIESVTGRLIVGGLEDFASTDRQITSARDAFEVTPGRYALHLFQLDWDRHNERLRRHIGDNDLEYYEQKHSGCPLGCLLFVAALGTGAAGWVLAGIVTWLWYLTAGLVVIGVAHVAFRVRDLATDERYQEISERVGEYEARFPPFLIVLRRVLPDEQVSGGWHDLA